MANKMVLKLHNWKCFESQGFELPKGNFLILDENGLGKTSVLSALYSLLTGKAFPGTKFQQYLKLGTEYMGVSTDRPDWYLTGRVSPSGRVTTKYQKPPELDFLGLGIESSLTVLTYQPTDNYWLFQARTPKLTLFDSIISNYNHEHDELITNLNKQTKSKLELIKHSNATGSVDWIMVDTLSQSILELSIKIWKNRLEFCIIFETKIKEFMDWINLDYKDWQLELEMTTTTGKKIWIKNNFDFEAIENQLGLQSINYQTLWYKEAMIEKVMFGANRDDFVITCNYQKLETILSRGEMRLFVLFCKTINTEHSSVIWLMDDIFNELDEVRENIIVDKIIGASVLSVVTGTKFSLDALPKYSIKDLTILP